MISAPGPLSIDRLRSPLGTLLISWDDRGRLRALGFHDHEARMLRLLRLHYGEQRSALAQARAPPDLRDALDRFFAGELNALTSICVETGGTQFQRRVWTRLRQISPGATATYGGLALELGNAKACRAVGLANGANPVAIAVPCHRVIGRDAALTGYAGGIERKRWLLAHERQWSSSASPPPLR